MCTASHYHAFNRYFARVIQVFPPKPVTLSRDSGPVASSSTASSPLSDAPTPIHKVAEDLKVPVKDSIVQDDPAKYVYKVQILEEEKQPGFGRNGEKSKGKETNHQCGALTDVQCNVMGYVQSRFVSDAALSFIQPRPPGFLQVNPAPLHP